MNDYGRKQGFFLLTDIVLRDPAWSKAIEETVSTGSDVTARVPLFTNNIQLFLFCVSLGVKLRRSEQPPKNVRGIREYTLPRNTFNRQENRELAEYLYQCAMLGTDLIPDSLLKGEDRSRKAFDISEDDMRDIVVPSLVSIGYAGVKELNRFLEVLPGVNRFENLERLYQECLKPLITSEDQESIEELSDEAEPEESDIGTIEE